MATTIILSAFIFLILALVGREVWLYFGGRSELSSQRFTLRVVSGGVLVMILTGILVGIQVLHINQAAGRPVLFLCWWGACGLLAMCLVALAVLDMREVTKEVLRRESQLWRDVAEEMAKKKGLR